MNDLLWLVNHQLWGNVAGIPTSRNPNTPEGLNSWLSIDIHRISVKVPQSTEVELKNSVESERIPVELPRSIYSEDSWQTGKSSSPQNLTSLSTLQAWTWDR
jgi:hypothetical protein